jgi:hypothetical protein
MEVRVIRFLAPDCGIVITRVMRLPVIGAGCVIRHGSRNLPHRRGHCKRRQHAKTAADTPDWRSKASPKDELSQEALENNAFSRSLVPPAPQHDRFAFGDRGKLRIDFTDNGRVEIRAQLAQ